VLISGEVLDRWYTDHSDPDYVTETSRLFRPDVVAPLHDWLVQPITKLLFLGPAERLAEVAEAIHRAHPHQVGVVQTEETILQVMHATVSKAQALRVVAAEVGAHREQVMAIGDNANDVGMLRWAGLGVAVANAVPKAAAAADAITARHDDEGVAKAVQKYILTPRTAG
jgi:hydroxymethylpyrimidine pyrophosphatase-like HAD family hydrolase